MILLLHTHTLDAGTDEDILAGLLEAIAELPPCNKDTLAYIILHLQKSVLLYVHNVLSFDNMP